MQFDIAQFYQNYLLPWGINLALSLLILAVGIVVARVAKGLVRKAMQRLKMDQALITFSASILGVLIVVVTVIAALDRIGIPTSSLVAVVAAAGLAIGLALKDSLQNFASGVMLVLFRPFKTGDYVEAGGTAGIVEQITIFNTVMRTGDNREITVPNGAIYSDNIINYSARETRRLDLVFGISYESDLAKAKSIIKEMIDADERVLAEPAPLIAVSELADSSVNIVVRPWVKSSDYWPLLYDLNERIKLAFDDNGIVIPYPQMDVHLSKSE